MSRRNNPLSDYPETRDSDSSRVKKGTLLTKYRGEREKEHPSLKRILNYLSLVRAVSVAKRPVDAAARVAVGESSKVGWHLGKGMSDKPGIEWPDDIQCIECGAVVDDDGVKIQYESFITPVEPELYAWCEEHAPSSEDEEEELWRRVKRGDELEQAQSWEGY